MAQQKIGSLQERKSRLAMESDNLRYHLSRRCQETAGTTRTFVQGIQVGQRVFLLITLRSPFRRRNKAAKLLAGFRLAFRLFK
jgi:hypothetical protein